MRKKKEQVHEWEQLNVGSASCLHCEKPHFDEIHNVISAKEEEPQDPESAEYKTKYVIEAQVYKELGCTEELTLEFIKQTMCNIQLFDKKQKDYGRRNISRFGEQGVLVRSSDKFERLVTLNKHPMIVIDSTKTSIEEITAMSKPGKVVKMSKEQWTKGVKLAPQNESIEDTWQDISNYATIALLVRKGVWPTY